ncbi:hypothetical protein [Shewanella sedimentimangrovi]|uniref:Lipoprotein n=1 Tax=Shewanella sedimentimangrovi TaxID=2814293 RepID=A0ABX7R0C5_9GAMM|nr:hypothetical protein [Shewanella sedimentimangrovi]QSX36540.1 hypothetical protein JYB85_14810 [Shewanella sedimentimangrovi]
MKKIIMALAFALTVGCSSTYRVIESDINTAEISNGIESSQSSVAIYLHNEGTESASIRFETRYKSNPKQVHRLYVFDQDVPKLKEMLAKFQEQKLTVEDMSNPLSFGHDKGIFGETRADGKRYVRILTVEGAYLFPESSIPSLINVLTKLELAAKI